MKNAFLAVFASAALSFTACNDGEKHDDAEDSVEVENQVNAAMDSVSTMTTPDTVVVAVDTVKQ